MSTVLLPGAGGWFCWCHRYGDINKEMSYTPAASHRAADKTDNILTINEPSGQLSWSKRKHSSPTQVKIASFRLWSVPVSTFLYSNIVQRQSHAYLEVQPLTSQTATSSTTRNLHYDHTKDGPISADYLSVLKKCHVSEVDLDESFVASCGQFAAKSTHSSWPLEKISGPECCSMMTVVYICRLELKEVFEVIATTITILHTPQVAA